MEDFKKQVEEQKKFEELSKPLIKYLNENFTPHTKIIITTTTAEVVSGEKCIYTEEFLKD